MKTIESKKEKLQQQKELLIKVEQHIEELNEAIKARVTGILDDSDLEELEENRKLFGMASIKLGDSIQKLTDEVELVSKYLNRK